MWGPSEIENSCGLNARIRGPPLHFEPEARACYLCASHSFQVRRMPIVNRISEFQPEITAWRRALHAHPELMYEVHRTAEFGATKLREFGCDDVATGIGRTGVVGRIKGRKPARDGGLKVVALRADMDALPLEEETGAPYRSTVPGRMHACGHDGHTAMLLGAARYLAETRNFAGEAVLVFQPAEEGGAGAAAMLDDGLVDRYGIDEIYGIHNAPRVAGEVAGQGRVSLGIPPLMGAEDFAYMLQARPGAFIFLGNGDSAGWHLPAFDINDDATVFGTSYWVRLVETQLPA